LYAEAESRLTLAALLTLLIFALAFRGTPWVLLTLPLPAVLVLYSFAKERAANDVVMRAVCINVDGSTAIARTYRFIEDIAAVDGVATDGAPWRAAYTVARPTAGSS